jgi:hypothetical protein
MSPRDLECSRYRTCRESVLDLIFESQFPGERHIETLLDRLEGERTGPDDLRRGKPR